MRELNQKQKNILTVKQKVIRALRTWFEERNFSEMFVPISSLSVPLEPTIYPFVTHWKVNGQLQELYLAISPEKRMKQYLAAGVGDCYTIGHCFRNLERAGERHTPEFLMLEWYRTPGKYEEIMQDVQQLLLSIYAALQEEDVTKTDGLLVYKNEVLNLRQWQEWTVSELWRKYVGEELEEIITDEKLFLWAKKRGYQVDGATWEQIFNQVFLNEVECHFGNQPFILRDFPARLSPLCRVSQKQPWLAERFEVYIGGMELGNGMNENLDDEMVRQYFEQEQQLRLKMGATVQPIDEGFLNSLKLMRKQERSFAGIGIGVERLIMLMANEVEIQNVGWTG